MSAYLVLLVAVLSRVLPGIFHTTSVGFTAVGGGLLFFGARRSRWQTILAVLTLMATDYYLTVYAYSYPFHASAYLITWFWYGAVCLFGHQVLAKKSSALRVGGAILATSTSFFVLSNFAVWLGGMYSHTFAGLVACYTAAIPFYANDTISTALTAGAFFGLPALAESIARSIEEAHQQHLA